MNDVWGPIQGEGDRLGQKYTRMTRADTRIGNSRYIPWMLHWLRSLNMVEMAAVVVDMEVRLF